MNENYENTSDSAPISTLTPRADGPPDLDCPLCGHARAGGELKSLFELPYREARARFLHAFEVGFLAHLRSVSPRNVSAAARRARMDRSYLIKLLKRHGII